MKKILLIILMSVNFIQAQETKFELTPEKFTDFVVIPFEGKTQAELYKKSLEWLQFTYKNPKEVLKADIENEYIRFEGAQTNLYCINSYGKKCYDVRYVIEISFKDGKVKFDVINSEFFMPYSQYSTGGYYPLSFDNTSVIFKDGKLRKTMKYINDIPNYYNTLVEAYSSFVKSEVIPTKKSDW